MQTHETGVSGGEGVLGVYGSITAKYMHAILVVLACHTAMGAASVFVDIGHGLGRPLLHSLVYPGVAAAVGYELDEVKYRKSVVFVDRVFEELLSESNAPKPSLHRLSVTQVGTLSPATHAYTFWQGLSRVAKMAIGRLFRCSLSMKAIAVVQPAWRSTVDPVAKMAEYGFGPLELIASFAVKMSGSGRGFTAYIFRKPVSAAAAPSSEPEEPQPYTDITSAGMSDDDPDMESEPTAAEAAAHAEEEQQHDADVDLSVASVLRGINGATLCQRGVSEEQDEEEAAVAEEEEEEEYRRLRAKGKPMTEPPRDSAARALAPQEQLFRPSRLAPDYEVSPLAVVRRCKDRAVMAKSRFHKRDQHYYIRLTRRRSDVYYPLRNLVASEWVEGAYDLLAPGLCSRGLQKQGAGTHRVYHVDGDRANNAAHNLVLAPINQPPPPVLAQSREALGSISGTDATGAGGAAEPQRRSARVSAAAAAAAAVTDLAGPSPRAATSKAAAAKAAGKRGGGGVSKRRNGGASKRRSGGAGKRGAAAAAAKAASRGRQEPGEGTRRAPRIDSGRHDSAAPVAQPPAPVLARSREALASINGAEAPGAGWAAAQPQRSAPMPAAAAAAGSVSGTIGPAPRAAAGKAAAKERRGKRMAEQEADPGVKKRRGRR